MERARGKAERKSPGTAVGKESQCAGDAVGKAESACTAEGGCQPAGRAGRGMLVSICYLISGRQRASRFLGTGRDITGPLEKSVRSGKC